MRHAQKVKQADNSDQGCVLEQLNERVHDSGNGYFERLRQDDEVVLFPIAESQRVGGLKLPLGQRLQSAANRLGGVGGLEKRDGYHGARHLVKVHLRRKKQRQQVGGHEQNGDERRGAPQLNVKNGEGADDRQVGAAAERHDDSKRQGGDNADRGQHEGEHKPAPLVGVGDGQPQPLAVHQGDGDEGKPRFINAPSASFGRNAGHRRSPIPAPKSANIRIGRHSWSGLPE